MASLPPAQGAGDAADRSVASKVAIPRLEGHHGKKQEKPRKPKPPRNSRTQRACDNCRKRKVRCTGEPIQCRNCVDQGATCVYSMARRDRFKEATQRNTKLVALLKALSSHVDDDGQKMIDKHLESLGDDGGDAVPTTTPEMLGKHSRESTPSDAQSEVSESSDEDTDPLDEDLLLNRESRATGYVGSNSSIQWLRSLKTRIESTGLGHPASRAKVLGTSLQPGHNLRVSSSTFYLDDDDLELDVMVDPYELPRPEIAEILFDYYVKTIHPSFPILPASFENEFRKWNDYRKSNRVLQIPEEWQAMLNLVLAIGAQYSRLIQAGTTVYERQDVVYMTRACRILHLDKIATSLPAPSLMFIQSLGLLSLYYLTVGQVSRAWMMVGISLRFSLAAGLHLRNDDPSAMANKKETSVRTWWGLHSIESLLCAIIGRPCIIPNDECTVPLPHIEEKKPSVDASTSHARGSQSASSRGDSDTVTRSSFLGARVTIAIIMQKALTKLYSPQLAVDSWDRVQSDITALLREIDDWAIAARLAGLSPAISLEEAGIERAKLVLSFHYHSAKLLICRPCLCRIERRNKGQSGISADFYQRTADLCVESAQAITGLLPDQVDLRFIYEQCPWWSMVHHIMQAIAVFLLKMSLGKSHSTHVGEDLSESVRKLTRWLHSMSAGNNVAYRAYQIVLDIIRASAPRIRIDISDITSDNADAYTRTKTEPSSSRPSISTTVDSSSSRATHSTPGESASSRAAQSTPSESAASLLSPPGHGTSNKRHQSHQKRQSQSQLQPQSQPQTPFTTNLSPNTFNPSINWSPQDIYAPSSSSVSPNTQMSTPQDTFPSTTTTDFTPTSHQFPSLHSEPSMTQDQLNQQQSSFPQDLSDQFQNQPFENYNFNSEFSLDASMQMPSIFGNPFLTYFDQADALAGMFGGSSSDGSISETAGMGIGMGDEQGQGQQHMGLGGMAGDEGQGQQQQQQQQQQGMGGEFR